MHALPPTSRRRIGFLGYDGMMALDLAGPSDAFASAGSSGSVGARAGNYEIVIVAASRQAFTTESGLKIQPHACFADAPEFDTLIIPGGAGSRAPRVLAAVTPWLREVAGRTRRVASVCTGIYLLAATGLLDGRRVATHWRFAAEVAARFPALRVDPDALFIRDGKFYSSAGVTAGIDLALALIEEDCGPGIALAVARELVVYLKRAGGQEQFSEPLKFQMSAAGRFADLAGWIVSHLDGDLSVEALATRACVSPRHFGRLFKATFGRSPVAYTEELRLSEARQRLTSGHATIEHIAGSLGYHSADVFRRAFERRFRVAPATYRARFGVRLTAAPLEPRAPLSRRPPKGDRQRKPKLHTP